MKIAILSRYQETINRGAETFVRELAGQLARTHEVEILSGDRSDSLPFILKGNYQIVISINGGRQSFKASLGRILGKYKLVITGQAGIGRGERFNLLVKPDLYVALTEYMFKWAKKWAWGTKVIKIPNGVDKRKFSPKGEKMDFKLPKPVILSVGALVWYKHHERVIKAVSNLKEGSLLIVGEGPQREELEKMGGRLLKGRFGIIKANFIDMPKVYRGADLFSLPSWEREAFGIVYIEAMASGLGVVAPDDLARREIVGEAGILTDVSDTKEYANAIKKALMINWKERSLKQSQNFSWEKAREKYNRAFEELIKK